MARDIIPPAWQLFAEPYGGFLWIESEEWAHAVHGWYVVFIPARHLSPVQLCHELQFGEAHLGDDEPRGDPAWGVRGASPPVPMVGTACFPVPPCEVLSPGEPEDLLRELVEGAATLP